MKLNMNEIPTLKKLLSPEMYIAYTKYKQGMNINVDNRDSNENNEIQAFDNIYSLLAFKILKRALYYTPVVTGTLRNSAYIKRYGTGYEIGYTAHYAIYVHEIGFNKHEVPTQYKYLEDAAFEVMEEYFVDTGNILNIKIEYDPLRVFVGVDDAPGQNLGYIKIKQDTSKTVETYNRLLNDFYNFDINTASESDMAYYKKMTDFFKYYRNRRHYNDWDIIKGWVDRNRHK